MAKQPSRMLQVLGECGALARLLPELVDGAWARPALDRAAAEGAALDERYALLGFADAGSAAAASSRLRADGESAALAQVFARERPALAAQARTPEAALDLLERCDALRRGERFVSLLRCAAWQAAAPAAALQALRRALDAALRAASAAAAAAALARGASGPAVGQAVRAARLAAIEAAWPGRDVPTSPA
jgi:tRNA nucleotidyltransferase (CCA-adding enzyme)